MSTMNPNSIKVPLLRSFTSSLSNQLFEVRAINRSHDEKIDTPFFFLRVIQIRRTISIITKQVINFLLIGREEE